MIRRIEGWAAAGKGLLAVAETGTNIYFQKRNLEHQKRTDAKYFKLEKERQRFEQRLALAQFRAGRRSGGNNSLLLPLAIVGGALLLR